MILQHCQLSSIHVFLTMGIPLAMATKALKVLVYSFMIKQSNSSLQSQTIKKYFLLILGTKAENSTLLPTMLLLADYLNSFQIDSLGIFLRDPIFFLVVLVNSSSQCFEILSLGFSGIARFILVLSFGFLLILLYGLSYFSLDLNQPDSFYISIYFLSFLFLFYFLLRAYLLVYFLYYFFCSLEILQFLFLGDLFFGFDLLSFLGETLAFRVSLSLMLLIFSLGSVYQIYLDIELFLAFYYTFLSLFFCFLSLFSSYTVVFGFSAKLFFYLELAYGRALVAFVFFFLAYFYIFSTFSSFLMSATKSSFKSTSLMNGIFLNSSFGRLFSLLFLTASAQSSFSICFNTSCFLFSFSLAFIQVL